MITLMEAVFGGFISKVINDVGDVTKEKIKRAVRDKKNQDLSTKIYRVIEKTLNALTNDKYKNADILYDATECLFGSFKDNKDNLEAARAGLSMLIPNVNDNICEIFVNNFFDEVCQDGYLFKRISLILQEMDIKYSQDEFSQINKIIEKNHKELSKKLNDFAEAFFETNLTTKKEADTEEKFQNNKKGDYLKTWNSRLFLHVDNDERAITLKNAFIMPDYDFRIQVGRMDFSDKNTIGDVINKFVIYNRTSSMLITGAPGIGKTSIISWMANEFKDNEDVIILRFRDWESGELNDGLLKAICNTLKCSKQYLENTVLVLDGFDEIKSMNDRGFLLNNFFNDVLDFDNFKFIITSRPDYIDSRRFNVFLELLPFNISKICRFYQLIKDEEIEKNKIDRSNLKVIGIPVILYMAIMSEIDFTQKTTKPELYNHIFAKKGGIFDKFCYDGIGYDKGIQILRDPKNITKYLTFLAEVAFVMFENDELVLNKGEYEIPELDFQGNHIKIMEFPIKYIFEKTNENIEFIHKSIYEYFVSEYIFKSLRSEIVMERKAKKIAGMLGKLFKNNILSPEILEFLRDKINYSELKNLFQKNNEAFQLMLQNGMTYHASKYYKEAYKNVMDCEMNVFYNMLEILHLWDDCDVKFNDSIIKYIRYNYVFELNLSKANLFRANLSKANLRGTNLRETNLSGANLRETNLRRANLRETNLIRANLSYADLRGADLIRADLRRADLRRVDLSYADLRGADLRRADLNEANLSYADLRGANLIDADLSGADLSGAIIDEQNIKVLEDKYNLELVKVFNLSTQKTITYKEYCKRKRQKGKSEKYIKFHMKSL